MISLLYMYPKEMKSERQEDTCNSMSTAA
jgi:hypothetical protein